MGRARIRERKTGIYDPLTVKQYDHLARQLRDLGWSGVKEMLSAGLSSGALLELGPGPGYLGLELARQLGSRSLTGCEPSPVMAEVARKNAAEYGLAARYVVGSPMNLPFPDGSFDCVVSNGCLHEWETPRRVFDEIWRVLRPGGRFCVTELWLLVRQRNLRLGLRSSMAAAYTVPELEAILLKTRLSGAQIHRSFFGLRICGAKE